MNPWGLKESHIHLVQKTLAEFPEIREVRIFGSRAMGNFKPGSDIDLALYGDGPIAHLTRLSAKLNEELPLPYLFDVVDYAAIENPDLTTHIDRFGQIFYRKA